jgi:hypothetical protein
LTQERRWTFSQSCALLVNLAALGVVLLRGQCDPQGGTHSAIGKGATNDPFDCSNQRIAAWNMVRQP